MCQIDRDALESTLTCEMVSATCTRGFDFHMGLAHEHRARALQFVPGLGPRKAAHLLQEWQARAAGAGARAEEEENMDAIETREQARVTSAYFRALFMPRLNDPAHAIV